MWPQLRTARSRPDEVRAIYPHSGSIPRKVWQEFFQSAQQEIGILTDSKPFPAEDKSILGILHDRAQARVKVRICIRAPDSPGAEHAVIGIRDSLDGSGQGCALGNVEIRVHGLNMHNSIFRADDGLIVGERAFGISASATPPLHLCGVGNTGLVATQGVGKVVSGADWGGSDTPVMGG